MSAGLRCAQCGSLASAEDGVSRDENGRAYVSDESFARWQAEACEEATATRQPAGSPETGPPSGRRVVLTRASDITPEALRWLWDRRLPLRGLSLIAGEPGLGKSTLTVELAADVTRGQLDGDLHGQPADVLIATAEDHFASVVWGRLTAAGADMHRVHRVHVEHRDGEELLTLPDDVAEVEARCAELAGVGWPVALVIVDPITAFMSGQVDTHRDAAVRRVLAPLAGLAERQQLAVVGVAHLNKDTAGKLLSRVGGSVAFGAAPRSVLAFARHPDDPDGEQGIERVIVHAKSNHGRYAPSLAARIESRAVETVGEVSRLVIDGECQVGPDDLGAQGGEAHERPTGSPTNWRTASGTRAAKSRRGRSLPGTRRGRSSGLRADSGSRTAARDSRPSRSGGCQSGQPPVRPVAQLDVAQLGRLGARSPRTSRAATPSSRSPPTSRPATTPGPPESGPRRPPTASSPRCSQRSPAAARCPPPPRRRRSSPASAPATFSPTIPGARRDLPADPPAAHPVRARRA